MSFKLKFSLQRLAIMLILLVIFIPFVSAQAQTDIPADSFAEWFRNHAAIIGLVISEVLAFLPAKVSGIVKTVYSILEALTKKKYT